MDQVNINHSPLLFGDNCINHCTSHGIAYVVILGCHEPGVNSFGHHDEGELGVVAWGTGAEAILELGHFELNDMLQLSLPHPITVHKDTVRKGLVQLIVPSQSTCYGE